MRWWLKWDGGLPWVICALIVFAGIGGVLAVLFPKRPPATASSSPPSTAAQSVVVGQVPAVRPVPAKLPNEHDYVAESFAQRGLNPDAPASAPPTEKPRMYKDDVLRNPEAIGDWFDLQTIKRLELSANFANLQSTCDRLDGESVVFTIFTMRQFNRRDIRSAAISLGCVVGIGARQKFEFQRSLVKFKTPRGSCLIELPIAQCVALSLCDADRQPDLARIVLSDFLASIDWTPVDGVEKDGQ